MLFRSLDELLIRSGGMGDLVQRLGASEIHSSRVGGSYRYGVDWPARSIPIRRTLRYGQPGRLAVAIEFGWSAEAFTLDVRLRWTDAGPRLRIRFDTGDGLWEWTIDRPLGRWSFRGVGATTEVQTSAHGCRLVARLPWEDGAGLDCDAVRVAAWLGVLDQDLDGSPMTALLVPVECLRPG